MKNPVAIAAIATITLLAVAWPTAAMAYVVRDPGDVANQASSLKTNLLAATQINPKGSWTVYHHDNAHTGSDLSQPGVCCVKAGWTSVALDAQIYASPLVYGGIVYAATLNNTVYALNQIDGSVIWSNHLRTPENRPNGTPGGWQCGNATPQGILGTGVIDPSTGRIYVATLSGVDDHYRLEGLNLSTGVEEVNTDISAYIGSSFDWTIQQQRGALAVANGYVYVPFGGRAGDCGNYHGWVFAMPTNGSAIAFAPYVTPGNGSGFWAAGGVVVDDSTGKVFVTSGNAMPPGTGPGGGCSANGNGTPVFENNAVIRLSATLAHEDSFVPPDWQNSWCTNDEDLGSASSVLISPNLMFQSGKWGTGFLLNPKALGGMGKQLFPVPPVPPATYQEVNTCLTNHGSATFGSFAYAAPFVYLECEGRGIVALRVDTTAPSFSSCDSPCLAPSWRAGAGITFGPPIVAGGLVWAATNGGGLYAYDAITGVQAFHSAGFGINRFVTPAEAGGQVFVPSNAVIRSFVMGFTTAQSTAAPLPARQPVAQTAGPSVGARPAVNQSISAPPPFGR
jgi:outer membrane protein assembly factor BamB